MRIKLYPHQVEAIGRLSSGSILKGGVGTGKSMTALAYFFRRECDGDSQFIEMRDPKDLYIITTARKRDDCSWEHECSRFGLSCDPDISIQGVKVTIDSWNNISKYVNVVNAFFIFDEQRLSGKGAWVKSFYQIARKNRWILLSATPGDVWSDYIPVFVANGFYRNRTEFIRRHVVYHPNSKYPRVDRYIDTRRLEYFRDLITVDMYYEKKTVPKNIDILCSFDKDKMKLVQSERWNIYEEHPIRSVAEYYYLMRKVVNSDPSRLDAIRKLIADHPRVIIFYNFDYELEILRKLSDEIPVAEWNGHKHEPIPESDRWAYLVQYSSGAEAWNCVLTDTIIFYSLNYSYRIMTQSAGRTDRLNTKYKYLYYYRLLSRSYIDLAIVKALKSKKNFNEKKLPGFDSQFASKIGT